MSANRRRNDAIFWGLAWTLASSMPVFWLKTSMGGPLSLGVLIGLPAVSAIGWGAILAHALRREERAMEAALAAAGGASSTAIDGMAQVMTEQMQCACKELQRVDDLLGHAIGQLLAAFTSVSEQARAHENELAQAAVAAQGTAGGDRLRAAAQRVAGEVNGAVTALQFRDVVGQKLAHVRSELVALDQAMQAIRDASAQCARAELAPRVKGLLQQWQQARAAGPVRQELMHAGEIELF